jgi:hypothetical protein
MKACFRFFLGGTCMKRQLLAVLGLLGCSTWCSAIEFAVPVRVQAGGAVIRVESPGYASPCLADVDGDGILDLLVGQFNQGKIQFFKGLGGGKFAKGEWIQVDGAAAKVPGVW